MKLFFTVYIMFMSSNGQLQWKPLPYSPIAMTEEVCENTASRIRYTMGNKSYIAGHHKHTMTLVCLPYRLQRSIKGEEELSSDKIN